MSSFIYRSGHRKQPASDGYQLQLTGGATSILESKNCRSGLHKADTRGTYTWAGLGEGIHAESVSYVLTYSWRLRKALYECSAGEELRMLSASIDDLFTKHRVCGASFAVCPETR